MHARGSHTITHMTLSGRDFPWRYLPPTVPVLHRFPAGSFNVAPQLGEDSPDFVRGTSDARFWAALRSRSALKPHASQW